MKRTWMAVWGRCRRWGVTSALLASLAVSLALACSSSAPAPDQSAARARPATETRVVQAFASVMITSDPTAGSPKIDSVRISHSPIVLDVGERVSLSAEAFAVDGTPLAEVKFVWLVADPRAGVISGDGVFRGGVVPGGYPDAVTVTGVTNAVDGIKFATAAESVTLVGTIPARELTRVVIVPGNPTVLKDQIYRLRAVGFDAEGLVIPEVSFVWELAEPSVGELNSIGYLTAEGAEGLYESAVRVTGEWEGRSLSTSADVVIQGTPRAADFMTVQILPQTFYLDPRHQLKLEAVALNGLGELVTGTQLRWSVSDEASGIIDGTGLFTAGESPGIYTEAVQVEAIVPGERGHVRAVDVASVVIRQGEEIRRLEKLWVLPDVVTMGRAGLALLIPRAVNELGALASNVLFSWEMVTEGVGEIDEHGRFTSTGSPGAYPGAIAVSALQKEGDVLIQLRSSVDVVITGNLEEVEISPTLAVVAPGNTVHLIAASRDTNGVVLTGLVVRWSVTDKSVGSIDAFGNFTAGKLPGVFKQAIRAEVVQTLPR